MDEHKLIKIGIAHGNPNGIASELILKTLNDAHLLEICTPIVYGSSKVLAYHRKAIEVQPLNINNIAKVEDADVKRVNVINVTQLEIRVEIGKATPESARYADMALLRAVEDLQNNLIDALVIAPASIDPVLLIHPLLDTPQEGFQIWVNDTLRIAIATTAMNSSDASAAMTQQSITAKLIALHAGLTNDFMVLNPRIAVLALNTPAGKEEHEIIVPAIRAASDKGVQCFGVYDLETFFASEEYKKFDAILALCQDQGKTIFHTLAKEENSLYIGGIPHIVASPDFYSTFEQAGKNATPPDSLRNAIYLAVDIYHHRQTNAYIRRNPLKKQYFERGSDNEKLDLTKDDSALND